MIFSDQNFFVFKFWVSFDIDIDSSWKRREYNYFSQFHILTPGGAGVNRYEYL